MTNHHKPRCPQCGRRNAQPMGELFKCKCGALFDGDPDEGGDFSDENPAARLERAERRRGSDDVRRN